MLAHHIRRRRPLRPADRCVCAATVANAIELSGGSGGVINELSLFSFGRNRLWMVSGVGVVRFNTAQMPSDVINFDFTNNNYTKKLLRMSHVCVSLT